MAFALKNLAPLGNPSKGVSSIATGALGQGAPRHWSYVTEDTHATVDSSGYFNAGVAYQGAYNLLQPMDIIWVVVVATGALSTYGPHIVTTKSAGALNVAVVGFVGAVTDSD